MKSRLLVAAALLTAGAVRAQEFEIDLSEPVAKVAPEFRPSIAILPAVSAEPPEDAVFQARARIVGGELVRLTKDGEQFKTVLEPTDVARQLGAGASARALDWAGLEKLARALKVDRIVTAEVKKQGGGALVTLRGFDPAQPEVIVQSQEVGEKAQRSFAGLSGKSQAQKDKEFLGKITGFLNTSLGKLATANGKIVVDNVDVSALVLLDGQPMGTGSCEAVVQRGRHVVAVRSAGYLPFEQSVTVGAQEAQTVKVSLVAKPVEVQVVRRDASTGASIFTRPGLYVAMAGALAVAAGVTVGMSAKATEARAQPDETGVVPITRAEAKVAQTQALMANVLVGAGAAAIAGGTLWVLLTPTAAVAKPPVDAPSEGGGFGVMLTVGGTF